jgi:hypothetical protein
MSRVRKTVSGLIAVDYPVVEECAQIMNPRLDAELYGLAREVHDHFVLVLNAVQVLKTETIDASVNKRLFLYEGQMMNEALGTILLLATHDQTRFMFHVARSAYEYTTRAIYFSLNERETLSHLEEMWKKGERYFKDIDLSRDDVREAIVEGVKRYEAEHPGAKRPHDISLKEMLLSLYGKRANRLYARFHVFYSPLVHGFLDGLPYVIEYDGTGTHVRASANVTNVLLSEVVRFAFTMTAVLKREFEIGAPDTIALFRRFWTRQRALGQRVQAPFPRYAKVG